METRERLLDAALEVFHSEGVSRPSLSKVAELAGVTRGAVYGHFENKSDLFSALCDRILLPTEALEERRARSGDDPLGALRDWCVFVLGDSAGNPDKRRLLEVIFHKCEMIGENAPIEQRRRATRRAGHTHIRELIALAVARDQLPADLDVDGAAWLLHHAVIGVLSQWLFAPAELDLGERAEQYTDALLAMLRAPPLRRRQEHG